MQLRQDFILQENIINGVVYFDFPLEDNIDPNGKYLPTPYGNSDYQHIIDIIFNSIGSIKRFPLLGFNIIQFQSSEYDLDTVSKKLTEQMKSDGYLVKHGCISVIDRNSFSIDTDFIIPAYS